jgi:hypothetical protein
VAWRAFFGRAFPSRRNWKRARHGIRSIQADNQTDDVSSVTADDELIQDALLRSSPSDLDDLLTTIEAYRTCLRTAQRLPRTACMQAQRAQVLECAGYCRKVLQDFTRTGRLAGLRYPESGEAHFTFALSWDE